MTITDFSTKQAEILKFAYSDERTLIADGAVRSGKTIVMSMGFALWAMSNFDRCNFAICSKTVSSAERNILRPFQQIEGLPFTLNYKISIRMLTISCGKRENYFYLFGGKDESSAALIQGLTLAGVLFDEVALMPKSFVEQAIARTLSFPNKKLWFNCNPENPLHWFYTEWLTNPERDFKHLHFLMHDNPIMTAEMIAEAESLYSGAFYDRYIKGEWVGAEGLVYPMFNRSEHVTPTTERDYTNYTVAMDYGIQNPTAMILFGNCGGVHYAVKEYYHSGRQTKVQKTDEEYYDDLCELVEGIEPPKGEKIKLIIDPSASSFIALAKKKGKFRVIKAKNSVIDGIQYTARCFKGGILKINDCCESGIKELGLYAWNEKSTTDEVIKENDHFCDAMRYYCYTTRIIRTADDLTALDPAFR